MISGNPYVCLEIKKKGENIGKEEWLEHFKKLLGGEETREEAGIAGERLKKHSTRGGDEDEIEIFEGLHGYVNIQEVVGALGGMKNNKAAGEDGVVAEFLKYLPLA